MSLSICPKRRVSSHQQSTNKLPKKLPRLPASAFPVLQAHCCAACSILDVDSSQAPEYRVSNSDFAEENLSYNKVFVDMEDFLCTVLHLPENWDSQGVFRKTIDDVLDDEGGFNTARRLYQSTCDKRDIQESALYPNQLAMLRAALKVIEKRHPRADGRTLFGAENLNPNALAFLTALNGQGGQLGIQTAWAEVLWAIETKHLDVKLDDGRTCNYRILTKNGEDPMCLHRPDPFPDPDDSDEDEVEDYEEKLVVLSEGGGSKKRVAVGQGGRSYCKKFRSAPGTVTVKSPVVRYTVKPALNAVRCIMEMFAAAAMRSHTTIALMDRDRLQLIHCNHSVFLVSNAISIKHAPDLRKFVGILIGLHLLEGEDYGLPPAVDQRQRFLTEYRQTEGLNPPGKPLNVGNVITLRAGDNPIVIHLGHEIYREAEVIGRSTRTLHASSTEWPGRQLVVKISFPDDGRQPESEEVFIKTATDKANEMGKQKGEERYWVLDHLPVILYAETKVLTEDPQSPEALVSDLCAKRRYVHKNMFPYKFRIRRITVYELLYPLETLTNVRDVAQVFIDVLATHKWLYDQPRILHRDISMGNIMYRLIDGVVYGVLNDFDLASFRDRLNDSSSGQRTGTPPFMAVDILRSEGTRHLYRHDLESIFYVMAVVASQYELSPRPQAHEAPVAPGNPIPPHSLVVRTDVAKLPLQNWFNCSSPLEHYSNKESFSMSWRCFDTSSSFQCLAPWLKGMRSCLAAGIGSRARDGLLRSQWKTWSEWKPRTTPASSPALEALLRRIKPPAKPTVVPTPFEEETLNGEVTYFKFLGAGLRLASPLADLRYRNFDYED